MPPDLIKHLWKIQDYFFDLYSLDKPFVLILRSKLCNQENSREVLLAPPSQKMEVELTAPVKSQMFWDTKLRY